MELDNLPLGPGPRIGPGRRTLDTHHKAIRQSKYSGKDLRRIRAERGCGRPPGTFDLTQEEIDRALLALTDNQRKHLEAVVTPWWNGDFMQYKADQKLKGNVWQKFLTKLDKLGLIDSKDDDFPRLTLLGHACGLALNRGD